MEENSTVPFDEFQSQGNSPIPFDLFVSKKHKGLGTQGFLKFTDSKGTLVYRVQRKSDKSINHRPYSIKLLLDASSNVLFSINRVNRETWQGFRENGNSEENFVFKVDRTTVNKFARTEFDVLLVSGHNEELKTELKMKGCPFKRSCTIYKDDSIVAESSLMYKLGIRKLFVPRSRFRVTIFPGFTDHSLIVSLIAIFFDGRKIWI